MKRALILCAIVSSLLSSCAPSDPYVGKWRAIGPNSDQKDLEIETSGGEYIWRDAQGTFKGTLQRHVQRHGHRQGPADLEVIECWRCQTGLG